MESSGKFQRLLAAAAAQIAIYERRAKSRIEKQYSDIMRRSAVVLAEFARTASFEELILAEKTFQENDLVVYAQLPSTVKTVRQGIDDLKVGEEVYNQLIENPEAYKGHKYRENEKAPPDKTVPLDAMRRALRGQVKRIENYRKNVMGNPQEYEFMTARINMLRRAEKMYDAIQREYF